MNRNPGLDLIRATAIGFVLLSHTGGFVPMPERQTYLLGYIGVEVFFVLSGFLIGRILINNLINNGSIFTFWWRRWLRTVPSYILFLSVNAVIAMTIQWGLGGWKLLTYLMFLQNLYYPASPNFFVESWSLAIEEWFYISIPLCFYALKSRIQKKNNRLLGLIVSLIVLFVVIRYVYTGIYAITDFYTWDAYVRKVVLVRMDSLLVGILGAYLVLFYRDLLHKYRYVLMIAGSCFLIFFTIQYLTASMTGIYYSVFFLLFLSLSVLLLFPYIITMNLPDRLRHLVEFISKTSYILYLSHSPIAMLVLYQFSGYIEQGDLYRYGLLFAWLAITVIVSYLVHRFFEKPIMDLR